MSKNKIILAGGTGFLGNCLAQHFAALGYEVVIITRKHQPDNGRISYAKWNGKNIGNWAEHIEGAEAVINLTGRSVDCRYTEANKQLIYDSRLDATHVLGRAIKSSVKPPKVWINAASATIYRHATDRDMDEYTGEIGEGFSVDVCQKWEKAFDDAQTPHTRKVALRIGIVLGRDGGALAPLKNLAKWGLGGKQGKGNQYFSWLHEDDFVAIVMRALTDDTMQGVYNTTAPKPLPNNEMMAALRKATKRPFGLPTPTWMLHIGAAMIKTEVELILKSRRVVPKRLLEAGFQFKYNEFDGAVKNLV